MYIEHCYNKACTKVIDMDDTRYVSVCIDGYLDDPIFCSEKCKDIFLQQVMQCGNGT